MRVLDDYGNCFRLLFRYYLFLTLSFRDFKLNARVAIVADGYVGCQSY